MGFGGDSEGVGGSRGESEGKVGRESRKGDGKKLEGVEKESERGKGVGKGSRKEVGGIRRKGKERKESVVGSRLSVWECRRHACFAPKDEQHRKEKSQVKCLIPVIRENKIKYFAKSASTNKKRGEGRRGMI